MTMPPTYHLNQLGSQAQMMAKDCGNQRLAMILQYVALGSMIVMTGFAATQMMRDAFRHLDHDRGHGHSR